MSELQSRLREVTDKYEMLKRHKIRVLEEQQDAEDLERQAFVANTMALVEHWRDRVRKAEADMAALGCPQRLHQARLAEIELLRQRELNALQQVTIKELEKKVCERVAAAHALDAELQDRRGLDRERAAAAGLHACMAGVPDVRPVVPGAREYVHASSGMRFRLACETLEDAEISETPLDVLVFQPLSLGSVMEEALPTHLRGEIMIPQQSEVAFVSQLLRAIRGGRDIT